MFDTTLSCVNAALFCAANSIMWVLANNIMSISQ